MTTLFLFYLINLEKISITNIICVRILFYSAMNYVKSINA